MRGNTLRACRPLLLAEPIRANDGVLKLLGALKAAQFPAVGATQATVIGLLLELLQTCLVALWVLRRALRCLLGALQLAELTPLDATQTTTLRLQLLQATLRLAGDRFVRTGR